MMQMSITAVVYGQLAVCSVKSDKLEWIGVSTDRPQPPINAIPSGPVIEVSIFNDSGSSYLYRPPRLDIVDSLTAWELTKLLWRKMSRRQ